MITFNTYTYKQRLAPASYFTILNKNIYKMILVNPIIYNVDKWF